MKILYTLFADIRSTIKNSPLLIWVILLGISSAITTHFISYSVIEYETSQKSANAVYNTFSIFEIDSTDNIDYDKITHDPDVVNAFLFFPYPQADCIVVGWHGQAPYNWFPLGEGEFLATGESANMAYVSNGIATYRQNENTALTLFDQQYKIIGSTRLSPLNLLNGLEDDRVYQYYRYSEFIFLPLSELRDVEFSDACLRIQTTDFTENKSIKISQLAAELIDEKLIDEVLYPTDPLTDFRLSNALYFLFIGLLCGLSCINIISMYWHLLSQNRKKYAVYSLMGASSKRLWAQILYLYIILFVVSSLFTLLISHIIRPVLGLIKIHYQVDTLRFIYTILFDFLLTLVISFPKMKKVIHEQRFGILGRGNG